MRALHRHFTEIHRSLIVVAGVLLSFLSVHADRPADSLPLINNLCLTVEADYGAVLPHHSSIRYLLEKHLSGAEIRLSTQSYGRSAWDKLYRYPRYGAGYKYSTLGNQEVFGAAHTAFLFVDVPFSKRGRRVTPNYCIDLGFAYLTQVYDEVTNPLNMAISSRFNVYAEMKFGATILLHNQKELDIGFGFGHYSNGKMATPNLGINFFNLKLAVGYNLIPYRFQEVSHSREVRINRQELELVLSGGIKTDDRLTRNYYRVTTLAADYKFLPNLRYSFGPGIDLFYDASLGFNKTADTGGSYTQADLYQLGAHAGMFIRYSRLNVVLQLGTYLHANYYKYSRIYTRVGIRFEIHRNLLLGFTLKSHLAIADYVEWGIGYRIPVKK